MGGFGFYIQILSSTELITKLLALAMGTLFLWVETKAKAFIDEQSLRFAVFLEVLESTSKLSGPTHLSSSRVSGIVFCSFFFFSNTED